MTTEQDSVMSGDDLREIVENQLNDGDPIKVTETLMRLMMTGTKREEAIEMMACALALEVFDVMKNESAFNLKRYNSHLDELPEMSWMDED